MNRLVPVKWIFFDNKYSRWCGLFPGHCSADINRKIRPSLSIGRVFKKPEISMQRGSHWTAGRSGIKKTPTNENGGAGTLKPLRTPSLATLPSSHPPCPPPPCPSRSWTRPEHCHAPTAIIDTSLWKAARSPCRQCWPPPHDRNSTRRRPRWVAPPPSQQQPQQRHH
jgi:hypothetical protein